MAKNSSNINSRSFYHIKNLDGETKLTHFSIVGHSNMSKIALWSIVGHLVIFKIWFLKPN